MKSYSHSCIVLLLSLTACGQQSREKHRQIDQQALSHYDLAKPQVYKIPGILAEISGISFYKGNADTIYAEQDEKGCLFYFHLGDNNVFETKFGKKGDYEDVQICNQEVIVLRSDGRLYTFPLSEAANKDAGEVRVYNHLLQQGEYEGLYADNATGKVYVLCKHCNEKRTHTTTGYVFTINNQGVLASAETFILDVKDIAEKAGDKKIDFKPSALAKNEQTGEWFILSAVNKMLVIANSDWSIKAVFPLDPSMFNQPEGIAFDNIGNLYISNEKGSTPNATILKFTYHK